MSGKTFTVRRGTTAIPNQTIYGTHTALADDDGAAQALTIQALGLLLLLLSRPTGKASMGYRALMGRGMGKVALLRALKELGLAGHLYRFKRRSPAGSIITDTVIAEAPITIQEAEEEWLAQVAQLKGAPVDNPGGDRAADFDASRDAKGATVRRFTGARSNGASSVPDAKVSFKTPSLEETGENHAREESGHHSLGSAVDDDAATGQGPQAKRPYGLTPEQQSRNSMGAAMARAALRGTLNEVAPLQPWTQAGPHPESQPHVELRA